MKWKEIYEKSNNKKYAQIVDIDEPLKLKSNIKNFIANSKVYIILSLIIFISFTIIAYKGNIQAILATFFVLLILVILMIYNHTYIIETKNDKLIAVIDLKKIEIDYENLINIFMSRKRRRLLFVIPIYTYNINIIFIDGEEQMIMTLSTFMTRKKDVYNLFKKIKVQVLPQQREEAIKNKENEIRMRALIITAIIIVAIAFIIATIIIAINQRK